MRDDKEGVNRIVLKHGEPIPWGPGGEKACASGRTARSRSARERPDVLVHDESSERPRSAFALSRVTQETHGGTPVGIFRNVARPVYDELMSEQLVTAVEKRGTGDLAELLALTARHGRSASGGPLALLLARSSEK